MTKDMTTIERSDKQITDDFTGYVIIDLGEYGRYFAHDLAYLYMTGEWPKSPIVHLNGDKSDNRWVNLKESHLLREYLQDDEF